MKAASEIGFSKSLKFSIYSFLEVGYRLLFLPPARKLFLTLLGAKIGTDSIIMNVDFFNWHHKGLTGLKVGEECFIGDGALIDLYNNVILENQVTIAQRVTVLTHLNVGYKNHPLQKYFSKMSKPVVFQKGSVVAAGATILPGVTIGEQAFVAAGSLVNKDVSSKTLVGGVPAKVIRKIS